VPVITAEGIEIPTVELLLEQIAEEQRANIDPTLDTSPESPEGQMNGIFASHMREAWEVIALLFNLSPADAEDFMLDWISSLTGTFREGATRSTFRGVRSVSVNLEPGTSLPIGSEAHVLDKPDIRFRTTEEVENATASPADVLVEMESLDFGPIVANANTLTVIATPVLGWNSVTNPTDAEPGRLRESDAELRTKRERELRKPGTATVDAIAVDLESIEYEGETPVESAIVFQNTTSVTDARGLPPRSIEALVFAMYVEGTYDPLQYEGDESLAVAIADFMKGIAKSEMLVRFSKVIDAAHNVRGVTGITAVRFQAFDAPPFVNYQMGLRQYPLFDSGDVLLTMTAG
jgi:hypothetical protein